MNQILFGRQFEDASASKVWLLAQAKPGMMARAQRNLENQGFRVFVPQIRETRRVGSRFKDRVGPLFPGYIFVQVDIDVSPWRKINSTFGVSRLVSFAKDRPAVVPSELITDLRSRFSVGAEAALGNEVEAGSSTQRAKSG